jgi:hypothetical protein
VALDKRQAVARALGQRLAPAQRNIKQRPKLSSIQPKQTRKVRW